MRSQSIWNFLNPVDCCRDCKNRGSKFPLFSCFMTKDMKGSIRMEKKTGLLKTITSKNEIGTLFPLVIMCIVITAINPAFIAFDNIMDVFRTASYYLIVGAPLTLLLLTADMDLSIGAVTALGGVVCVFAMKAGLPMVVAILLGLAAGAAVGIFKAYVIVELELPALIVTLGIQYAVNGIV